MTKLYVSHIIIKNEWTHDIMINVRILHMYMIMIQLKYNEKI